MLEWGKGERGGEVKGVEKVVGSIAGSLGDQQQVGGGRWSVEVDLGIQGQCALRSDGR